MTQSSQDESIRISGNYTHWHHVIHTTITSQNDYTRQFLKVMYIKDGFFRMTTSRGFIIMSYTILDDTKMPY